MKVRFAAPIPTDGIYRTVGSFGDNPKLTWIYPKKNGFYVVGTEQSTIYRTPLGCLIDRTGTYQPEMAVTRAHKIDNILASVEMKKTETHIINRQIGQQESLNHGRLPPLRSHARGLMSRFDMDRLDGIDINKVLANNPAFYHQGYTEEGDRIRDLRRQPPLRSHARGLMSRFDMDRLDGIDVNKVLENNPAFYSKGYTEVDDIGLVLDKGEDNVTNIDGNIHDNVTGASQDGDTKTPTIVAGKCKKVPLKKRLRHFLRRVCCLARTA